nr:XrtB/PEP-CTERM-associated polysaccharide biosynthesis outer membrane protein EpsL [uncultured Albidiferax sp.]
MHVNRPHDLLPALLLLACMPLAWAQAEDTFQLGAGYSIQTDSNIYRLSNSAIAQGGRASAAERISRSSLGLNVNKPYSLQRFKLDVNLVDSRYENARYLSFVARNASAAWLWSYTPKLHGSLSSSRKESLNNFADNPTFNVRNERTEIIRKFDAIYELGAAWHVLSGLSSVAQTSVLPLAAEGDTSTNVGDLGLRYVWASGSTLTYTYKNTKGTYTNRTVQPLTLLDDGFRQQDNGLALHWLVSGKSTIDLSAAYISRTHPHFTQRDYSGFTSSASLNWDISGKSSLTASLTSDLASYQDTTTNFTRTNRLSLGPTWQISSKTAVSLRYDVALRDYLDAPGGLPGNQRSDVIRDASLVLDWQPYRNLSLRTSVQNAKRTSNQIGLDYNSNMASFAAKYSY